MRLVKTYSRVRRLPQLLAALALVGGGVGVWEGVSQASTPVSYNFQLDGDISSSTYGNFGATPPSSSFDWSDFFNANAGDIAPNASLTTAETNAGYLAAAGQADYALPDNTVFTQGSKDTLPISGWTCTQKNNVTSKDDLLNAYQVAWLDPSTTHLVVFFGAEKSSNLGDNNIAIWLLQDKTVNCDSSGGTTTFTGTHKNGDVLLAAAFSNGGLSVQIQVYTWGGCGDGTLGAVCTTASPGSLGAPVTSNQECLAQNPPTSSAQLPPSGGNVAACAITNETSVNPPWTSTSQAKTTLNGGLAQEQFYEGAVDLTQFLGGGTTTPCYATTITDTRSSTSPTATVFDFVRNQLQTCGSLDVHKYIDVNDNGTSDTGDITSGSDVASWAFNVYSGSPPSGSPVCSGMTDNTGTLNCPNLQPGTYTVTETQQSGMFNTQAGSTSAYNGASTVSTSVTVGMGDNNVSFGNDCFVKKTFEVDGVPTDSTKPSSITGEWTINSGDHGGTSSSGTVSLSEVGTSSTWSGSLSNVFTYNDNISWDFYAGTDTTHTVTGATGETLSAETGVAYPTCAVTNSVEFPSTTLTGFKYKDVNDNGSYDAGTDSPAQGFEFELKSGSTVVQVVQSDASGVITFTGVNPGTYSVHEVHGCTALPAATGCASGPPTGWVQTEPASSGDVSVTVYLGDTTDSLSTNFGDTPLSNISTTFSNDATNPANGNPATQGTWSCTQQGATTQIGSAGSGTYSATDLPIGTYVCTVTITDP